MMHSNLEPPLYVQIPDVKVLVSLSKEEFKMPSRQEQAKVPTPVKAASVQHKSTEPVKVAPTPAPVKAVATPASARPPDKPGPAGNMQQVKVDSSAVTVEHKQGTVKKAADVAPAMRPAVQPVAKPAVKPAAKPSPEDLLQQSIDAAVERATPVSYTDGKHCVTFYKFIQNKPDVPMLGKCYMSMLHYYTPILRWGRLCDHRGGRVGVTYNGCPCSNFNTLCPQ